jgi:hypothetical protein
MRPAFFVVVGGVILMQEPIQKAGLIYLAPAA